jgi:hypothetical protein
VDPTDAGLRFRWLATTLFSAIAIGGAIDLAMDNPTTLWSLHVLFEVGMLVLSLGAVTFLWAGWQDAGRTLEQTRRALEARGAERDDWRGRAEKLLSGLGQEIDRQFREWGLTPVERETALLLLKGYGHKEIAARANGLCGSIRSRCIASPVSRGVRNSLGISSRIYCCQIRTRDELGAARGAPREWV